MMPYQGQLQAGCLHRVLLLRAVLLCLCVVDLNALWSDLAQGACTARSWGWRQQLAFNSLLIPLSANLAGLAWPLLGTARFDPHNAVFHRVTHAAVVVGSWLQQWTGLGSTSRGTALLQGLMYCVHQDPQYMAVLAATMVSNTLANAVLAAGHTSLSTLASGVHAGALQPAIDTSTDSHTGIAYEALLQTVTEAGFQLSWFLLCVLVHHLYCQFFGCKQTLQLNHGTSHTWLHWHQMGAFGADTCRQATAGRPRASVHSSGEATVPQGHATGPVSDKHLFLQLYGPYLLKLVAVRVCVALYMAAFAVRSLQATSVPQGPGAMLLGHAAMPTYLAAGLAAMQLAHAALCVWCPSWLHKHLNMINKTSLYTFVSVQAYLLIPACWGTLPTGAQPEQLTAAQCSRAFPGFLLLAGMLAVHEDPGRWFTLQLTAIAVLMRHVAYMAALPVGRQRADSIGSYWLALPEYWVAVVGMSLVYEWVCVGKHVAASDKKVAAQSNKPSGLQMVAQDSSGVPAPTLAAPSKRSSRASMTYPALEVKIPQGPGREGQQLDHVHVATTRSRRGSAVTPVPHQELAGTTSAAPDGADGPASSTSDKQRRSILWADSAFPAAELAKMAAADQADTRSNPASHAAASGGGTQNNTAGAPYAPVLVAGSGQPADMVASTAQQQQATQDTSQAASHDASAPSPLGSFSQRSGAGAPDGEAGDDNPQELALVQRIACDILLCSLAGPPNMETGPPLLRKALDPATPLGLLQRACAVMLLLVFMLAPFVLLGWYICRPYAVASGRRQLFWVLVFSVGPAALQMCLALLQERGPWGPRMSLMILAGGMGLSDVLAPTFAAWLPPMASIFTAAHAWTIWGSLDVNVLLFDCMEMNIYPMATYAAVRFVNTNLQRIGVRCVYTFIRKLGGKRVLQRPRFWNGAAAVLSQMLVGGLLCWVLTVGPVQLPKLLDPLALLDEAKGQVLQLLKVVAEPANLQGMLGMLALFLCFLLLPGVQLWVMNATVGIKWRQQHRRRAGAATHGDTDGPSPPSSDSGGNNADNATRQRMAVDVTACITAAPALLLLIPRMVSAAVWPAPGVGILARLLGLLGALLHTGMQVRQLHITLRKPLEAVLQRDFWWPVVYAGTPAVLVVGTAALGLPGLWPNQLHLVIEAAGLGLMDVPWPSFAIWLPVLSGGFFGVHAYEQWSTSPWGLLAWDAMEYNAFAIVAYAATRLCAAAAHWLGNAAADMLAEAWYGGTIPASKQPQWSIGAAVASHALAAGVPMWVVLVGPIQLPDRLDGSKAAAAFKAYVVDMVERMGHDSGAYLASLQTSLAVLGLGAFFLAVSSVQALVLNNPTFRNPRQRRYEACKARVMALGEKTMSTLARLEEKAGPLELRAALLHSLNQVVEGCFPGSSLLLVLLEEGCLSSGAATCYVVAPTPSTSHLPQAEELSLDQLPSVEAALRSKRVLAGNNLAPGATGWSDWDALAEGCGLDCFLVMPLHCANQDMGALLVTSASPVSLDKYGRKLAGDLGHALSQAVYTLACIGQMKASDRIIHDILPEKVAEQLRRRVVSSNTTPSEPGTPHSPSPAAQEAPWKQLQPPCDSQDSPSSSGHSSSGSPTMRPGLRRERRRSALGVGDVPVVYKSWHQAVSVLFADIAGYTAMSTSVEPEQVMMLLHELFSKYDNLCSQYGVYKVETIGDCYMACCGLLTEDPDHAAHLVQFGQAILAVAAGVTHPTGGTVRIRVGIHSGRVMSGVVGSIRARYCLFGDTVNTASRMESTGVVDHIQISEDTYQLLGQLQGDFQAREAVAVKGKGMMQTYLLRPQVAEQIRAGGALACDGQESRTGPW